MAVLDRSDPGVLLRLVPFEGAEDEFVRIDLGDRILSFEYIDAEKGHDKVKLTLNNNDLIFFEDEVGLLGGGKLEVSWGYRELMSRPRIVTMEKAKGFTTLMLEGYDDGVLMDKQQRCLNYDNKTRSEVASIIALRNGFAFEQQFIDETPERFEVLSQAAETDSQLLRRFADREAFSWWIDTDGFHFEERDQAQAPMRVLTWYPGEGAGDVISVNMESDLTKRVSSVRSKSIDPLTGEINDFVADTDTVVRDALAIASQAQKSLGKVIPSFIDQETGEDLGPALVRPDGTSTLIDPDDAFAFQLAVSRIDQAILDRNSAESVNTEGLATKSENKALAGTRYKRAERKSLDLAVVIVGDPTFAAKTVIEMRGISSWLSGLYYVEEAKHVVKAGSYTVALKLSADGVHKILAGTTGKGKGANQNQQECGDHTSVACEAASLPEFFLPGELKRTRLIDQDTGEDIGFKWEPVDG